MPYEPLEPLEPLMPMPEQLASNVARITIERLFIGYLY
jgi:hypothetical protein